MCDLAIILFLPVLWNVEELKLQIQAAVGILVVVAMSRAVSRFVCSV